MKIDYLSLFIAEIENFFSTDYLNDLLGWIIRAYLMPRKASLNPFEQI
jgi:hypothetical protein